MVSISLAIALPFSHVFRGQGVVRGTKRVARGRNISVMGWRGMARLGSNSRHGDNQLRVISKFLFPFAAVFYSDGVVQIDDLLSNAG